jgi:hypothetical protein
MSITALDMMRECERAVLAGAPIAERLYVERAIDTRKPMPAEAQQEEFEAEFEAVSGQVGAGWAPLGSPVDRRQFPVRESIGPGAEWVAVALFPKRPLLGYVTLRLLEPGRFHLHVGVMGQLAAG